MKSAVGRADLVRALDGRRGGDAVRAAALLGFFDQGVARRTRSDGRPVDRVAPRTTAEPETLPLLRATAAAFEEIPPPDDTPEHRSPGLTHEDVSGAPPGKRPRHPSLAPWSRTWPGVRHALRGQEPGRVLDTAAVVRSLARCEVRRRLPRKVRRAWPAAVQLWIDGAARLIPFWRDFAELRSHIEAACGERRVVTQVVATEGEPANGLCRVTLDAAAHGAPRGCAVLVLSDLGAYGDDAVRRAWLSAGRRLVRAGHRLGALAPCPPDRIPRAVGHVWWARPWEGGAAASGAAHDEAERRRRAERLLGLVSPALLIEPGLLRAARRLLPPGEADCGTEADAWNHPEACGWDAGGLVLQAGVRQRLCAAFFAAKDEDLRKSVWRLIEAWHQGVVREILRSETMIWSVLDPTGAPPGDLADARAFFERVAASLGGGGAADRAAVTRYAKQLVGVVPEPAYVDRTIGPTMQRIWAAATRDEPRSAVPDGMDPRLVFGVAPPPTREPRWYSVRHVGRSLVVELSTRRWDDALRPGSPVAKLLAVAPWMGVEGAGGAGVVRHALGETRVVDLPPGRPVVLQTDRCRVVLGEVGEWGAEGWVEQPPWATASGRDRFGLWVDFEVGRAAQRMRWVPPGRFWMGSPEGESGRHGREVRHEVGITRGYWMADSPVTQALWSAVMGENPSRFVSPDRPVEKVSWEDCQRFVGRLNEEVPGLGVRLPTEAEWEHACRAGTETATWVGDLEILGRNNAPVLDAIAWYGGNCGVGFELTNGYDTTGEVWSEKQYDFTRGGSHAVKGKLPNPLGLYDMLGNVWEWCGDWYGPYDAAPTEDPAGPPTGSLRVLRGGSWSGQAWDVRAAYRFWYHPGFRNVSLGLRLARGHPADQGPEALPPEAASEAAERSGPRSGGAGPPPAGRPGGAGRPHTTEGSTS